MDIGHLKYLLSQVKTKSYFIYILFLFLKCFINCVISLENPVVNEILILNDNLTIVTNINCFNCGC